jgi:membrane fusion protein, multidrug efflux system
VTTGPNDGKLTVIASGLKAGDQVVIDGVDRLRDGAKVKIVDKPPIPVAEVAAGQHEGAPRPAADPPPSPAGEGEHHRRRRAGDQAGAGASAPTP